VSGAVDGVEVSTADLGVRADKLTAEAKEAAIEVANLKSATQILLEQTSGEATDAAVQLQLGLVEELTVQVGALRSAAALARGMADLYAETDAQLARLFGE
jgi:hypothetical protein